MSWLGGSLSSITGQISNLTKDILTEGTEETTGKHTVRCSVILQTKCTFVQYDNVWLCNELRAGVIREARDW